MVSNQYDIQPGDRVSLAFKGPGTVIEVSPGFFTRYWVLLDTGRYTWQSSILTVPIALSHYT